MKSVKQFLNLLGNGRATETTRDKGDNALQKSAVLSRNADCPTAERRDFRLRHTELAEPLPDVRMVTNASGKQFPVICNVRGKQSGKATQVGHSVADENPSGPFRNDDAGKSQEPPRPHCKSLTQNGVALRVSSVPSHPPNGGPTQSIPGKNFCLLSTSQASSCLLQDVSNVQSKKRGVIYDGQQNSKCKRDVPSAEQPLGDHNTNGLPLANGARIGAMPTSQGLKESYVPNTVILKSVSVQRTSSEKIQGTARESATDHVAVQPETSTLRKVHSTSCTGEATLSSCQSKEGKVEVPCGTGGDENSDGKNPGEVTRVLREPVRGKTDTGKPSVSKLKNRSKNRAQKRFWSFSVPRFMIPCSSSKINYSDSPMPSEQARSSTLPRLRSSGPSLLSTDEVSNLFKVTSLTSLHDLPDEAPKACLSQGDLPMAIDHSIQPTDSDGDMLLAVPAYRIPKRPQDEEIVPGNKSSTATGESHSGSENSTDNSNERPYIMPPRALRKYIKTNFRRLNIPETLPPEPELTGGSQVSSDTVQKDNDACGISGSTYCADTNSSLSGVRGDSQHDSGPLVKGGQPSDDNVYYTVKAPNPEESQASAGDETGTIDNAAQLKHTISEVQSTPNCGSTNPQPTRSFSASAAASTAQPLPGTKLEAENAHLPLSCDRRGAGYSSVSLRKHDSEEMTEQQADVLQETNLANCVPELCHNSNHTKTESLESSKDTLLDLRLKGNQNPASHVELDRQVDGASCSESLSSLELEITRVTDLFKRTMPVSRKLKVLDRPTAANEAHVLRHSGPRKTKKRSTERIRQLENEVWIAERELLLIKESLLRNHSRHGYRPPDRGKTEKSTKSKCTNSGSKAATESIEVQCDVQPAPETSLHTVAPGLILSGSGSDEARRIQEENALLQQELKEKCDLLAKIEEELSERDDPAGLDSLQKICSLPLTTRMQQREELRVTKEAISSLRHCFRLDDPYQHTLDTIEQSLCTLLERVAAMERNYGSGRDTLRRLNFDSTGDPRRVPLPNMGAELTVHRLDTQPHWSTGSPASTKVVYYTEKSVTPFLSVIPKRLGDIRLRDFKVVFDRPGQYRFHFKTLDPEFGMVKEEVLHDEDIVPGWDGKIIAWVEEDI